MPAEILVTDCSTRKALCAVRALGVDGYEVHAVTHTRNSAAIYSRFARRRFLLPSARYDPVEFSRGVLARLRAEKYDCVIPMEAESTRELLLHREEVEKYTRLPCPDLET